MRRGAETGDEAEVQDLESRVRDLCRRVESLAEESCPPPDREGRLQREVFAERLSQAERLLREPPREPAPQRIARLARLLEALDCSRLYFASASSG